MFLYCFFFFSSRRRHTRWPRDWSSDVCSSDLADLAEAERAAEREARRVLGEDPRDELPEAALLRLRDERRHGGAAESPAACLAPDVDAELADAVVALARPVQARGGPGDDHTVAL